MKKYFLIFSLLITGCTTTQELKQSPSCNVWRDQPVLGPQNYQVLNNSVEVNGQCLFLLWGCMSSKTDIDVQGGIYHQGEGMFSSRTKIATLRGSEVEYEKSIFDAIVSADPILIDMGKKTATRKVNLKIVNISAEDKLEFNNSCKLQEAAVGAVAFWINENKKK